jgi:hypothetical protein
VEEGAFKYAVRAECIFCGIFGIMYHVKVGYFYFMVGFVVGFL